jgi:hypothetical protein
MEMYTILAQIVAYAKRKIDDYATLILLKLPRHCEANACTCARAHTHTHTRPHQRARI